jgi:predicted membrane protein (TIGR00267 family)
MTIALSYAVSGFIPLGPYILLSSVHSALYVSIAVTILALFVFGFIKGRVMGVKTLKSGLQMAVVGSLAAGTAFLLARLIG